jgi:methionyl-tRNA formyltransferase
MITAAYGQLLSEEFLAVAPVCNIHASLLPLYRGSAPIQAAILNGDAQTGVTIMKTVKAMDAGDILLQGKIAIGPDDTYQSLHDKLSELGAGLMAEALDRLEGGRLQAIPQQHDKATYTQKVTKADGLIHWQESAETLARKIRAFNPWPAAYTYYRGDNIKIYGAESLKSDSMSDTVNQNRLKTAQPGTILAAREELYYIKCGEGILKIFFLQAPGKRVLPASEFLRGYKIQENDHFTQGEEVK